MFLWNFAFFIRPHSRPENNRALTFAPAQHSRWKAGMTIVYQDLHSDLRTIAYFNLQTRWIAAPHHHGSGGEVWVEPGAASSRLKRTAGQRATMQGWDDSC